MLLLLFIYLSLLAPAFRDDSKQRLRKRLSSVSNDVLHMSRTQFNQLGPCEVRRLTQLSSTDFILERLRRSSRLASREERLKTEFGSNADFHMSQTKRIINDNQPQTYESNQPRSQFFPNMAAFISSQRVHEKFNNWFML